MDKEGRTPLMLACTRGDLFDMVLTLLNLGANVKAYQPGTSSIIFCFKQLLHIEICFMSKRGHVCAGSHGGQPLHQAARLGLDRTVFLLLSRGGTSCFIF